jgi:hypothetical protein
MIDDLIERVAAAMWERTHDGRWYNWGDGQDESRIIHREDARVAIAAMREPTEAMLGDGWNESLRTVSNGRVCSLSIEEVRQIWQAMIDVVLHKKE